LLNAELGYCGKSDTTGIVGEIGELQKMVAAIRGKLAGFSSH
jgi:hypothetical protein